MLPSADGSIPENTCCRDSLCPLLTLLFILPPAFVARSVMGALHCHIQIAALLGVNPCETDILTKAASRTLDPTICFVKLVGRIAKVLAAER